MAVRIQDGSGNSLTSTANALDINVKSSSGTQTVSGTVAVSNFPATQPVSAAALPLPSGASTAAKQPALGTAGTPSADVISVQGVAGGTAQPVSGTVTSNIGTTNGLALDATLTGGTQKSKLVDTAGTNVASVSAAGALKVDGSAVTQPVSGSVSVSNFPATQPVSGTVNVGTLTTVTNPVTIVGDSASGAAKAGNPVQIGGVFNTTQPTVTAGQTVEAQSTARGAQIVSTGVDTFNVTVNTALPAGSNVIGHVIADTGSTTAVTGNVTAVQATGTNLHTVVDSGTVSVSNFPATQPVSGTVTANIGTSGSLALDASVTGLEVAQGSTTSGQKGILDLGAVTTAAPAYTTAQTSPLSLNTAGGLRVDGSGVTQPVSGTFFQATQPVSGTVTANAGSGNFTVAQATGTNLHAVVDSGSITATQATAANLNATVVGSGNFTVVQPTGTNLHTVVDSGTITAITNALPTGANTLGSVKLTDGTTVPGVIASTTSLKTDASSVAGTATAVSAAGVQKVGIVGNAGAAVDTAISSGAAPANVVYATQAPTSVAAGSYTTKFQNASGAAVNVKASAGNLYGFSITNETAAVAYIEFFNIATTPVLGTTAVVFAVKLPASANVTISPGAIALQNFTAGIGFACTTAENGTTAASVTGMIFYQ